ncbi:hypothetical protein GOP47_0006619 [Adiantum capillus-veneris]|uniref:Uncharacterized protein n=1 Tax=Adiantum capillus-veneris TaxID=13818 RepID=A0A9D4V477_ADICA|nr:hypothetical protein GOP47_0006619 [Adiantum capillus-veneris]
MKFSPCKGLPHTSTSFWSATYDRAVRTQSYNEFMAKVGDLPFVMSPSNHRYSEINIDININGLLQPNQETVESVLHASRVVEEPKIVNIAMDYFNRNWKASKLCGTLLHSIREERDQCHHIDMMLSTMPISTNEEFNYLQHKQMVEGLYKIAHARNPFVDNAMNRMFVDVEESYNALSKEVEKKSILIGRQVWMLEKEKGGCILHMLVIVVVGVTIATVVVAMHAVASVVDVPFAISKTECTRTLKRVHFHRTQSFKSTKEH